MQSEDQIKLSAYSMFQTDHSPKQVAESLEIAYPKALKYRNEFREALANGTVHELINVSKVTVERIANEVKQEMQDLNPPTDEAGFRDVTKPLEGELIEAVNDTVKSIDAYQALSDNFQETGGLLAAKIKMLVLEATTPEKILILVEALTKLQNAFFNKNMVNVNILNQAGGNSESSISKFSAFKKP